MTEPKKPIDEEKLFQGVLRLNAKIWGLVCGLLLGSAVFVATNWLVIKGGHIDAVSGEYIVGPHLRLLSQFFIGYRVSFFGSIIGFLWGFTLGTLGGAFIGLIYNKIVDLRDS